MRTMAKRIAALLVAGMVLDGSPLPVQPFPVNETIDAFLQDPVHVLEQEGLTPQDFKKGSIRAEHVYIALSHLAEACATIGITRPVYYAQAKECVATTITLATEQTLSPYDHPLALVDDFGDHGLYLTHLNIVLGSWKRLTNDDSYHSLNQRISVHLSQKTREDSWKNIPSYPSLEYRWPADETAALYSIWLYDQNYGTSIGKKPIEEWLDAMEQQGKDKNTGLYVSERTGTYPHADQPRGCALSWSIRYMAAFAPEKAAEQWELYKENFAQQYGIFLGFREWQRGFDQGFQDVDSGPIILENGVAATAFAIGASRAIGDEKTYNQLQRTETITRVYISFLGNDNEEILVNSLLASAIDVNMHSISMR